MSIFDRLKATAKKTTETKEEQAVGVGVFDGNETGSGETCLFLYGADTEALFNVIKPVLQRYPLCQGARVIIRKGKPGATERELTL